MVRRRVPPQRPRPQPATPGSPDPAGHVDRKLRVPSDGALITQPSTRSASASASSMQSPPANAATKHLVADVGTARSAAQVNMAKLAQSQMAGQSNRQEQPHWPPDRRRRRGCGRAAQVVASFGCSSFRAGFMCRNHFPEAGSTFLPLHNAATLILSVDWG